MITKPIIQVRHTAPQKKRTATSTYYMRCPQDLTDDKARDFWRRHSSRLQAQGLLNEATFDSFVLLSRVHGMLTRLEAENDRIGVLKFVGLAKLYSSLAKGFGLNTDKPRQPTIEKRKEEFGL